MDGDCFGGKLGIESAAETEVAYRVRECVYCPREQGEEWWMLQGRVQYPAYEGPVHYLQANGHNEQSLEQIPLEFLPIEPHKLLPDPAILKYP